MKILFLSDIHGRIENINKLVPIIEKEDFDKIVVLGDLYEYSLYNDSNSNEKIDQFLMSIKDKLILLRGNCDSNYLEKKYKFLVEDIKILEVDGFTLYLNHGHLYRYLKNDTFTDGVMVYGHEHIPYIKKESDMIYINTGSISYPRDNYGATYTIYDNHEFRIYQIDTNKVIFKIEV